MAILDGGVDIVALDVFIRPVCRGGLVVVLAVVVVGDGNKERQLGVIIRIVDGHIAALDGDGVS